MRWKIVIKSWPHSSGAGQEADQKAVGDPERYFYADAPNIFEAVKIARLIAQGIECNPAVWQAPVTAIFEIAEKDCV